MCNNIGFAYCIRLFFSLFSCPLSVMLIWWMFWFVTKALLLIEINIWIEMILSLLQLMDLSPLLKHSLTNFFPGIIWPWRFRFLIIYECKLPSISFCILHDLLVYIFIPICQVSILLSLQVCISCLASTSIYGSKFRIMFILTFVPRPRIKWCHYKKVKSNNVFLSHLFLF